MFEKNNPGLVTQEISERVGVPVPTIERWRRENGIIKLAPYKGFKSDFDYNREWLLDNFWFYSNKEIAGLLGVDLSTLQKWLKKIGFKKDPKKKWVFSPHPRGMAGKTHTAENKKKYSEQFRAMWADKNHVVNSREFKEKRSLQISLNWPKRKKTNTYSRCRRGRRADIGDMFFRSSWEANYARYLNWLKANNKIHRWEYEPDTFWFFKIKRGVRSYTPDFKVWETASSAPYFIEVKGWMDKKSVTKMKRIAKYHPSVRVVLVSAKDYKALSKQCSALIPGWEI